MLRDKANFHNILRLTSNNKQPGPDEIPNELLKNLPDQLQTCIHNLFIIQWLVGYTPDGWKESNTVLLYKKGDPLDLKNYRPIALANTLYKLWTSMLTEVLSKYAETYDILSNSQEGFRQHRNTIRQIQNVQNILSDARLTNQNLFLLYIDFSSAFNTIDHDKLLQTMYDLGFPEDAIYVIQDLYNNATTKAKLAIGTTESIQINRGTIQGDTLSPLLFTIFLEPLLRWLQVGGRGYRYGSLQGSPEHKDLTTSNAAYADDLLMMTNSHLDLRTQAEKVEAFCAWSSLELNLGKCGITGILYQDAASGLISHPYRREIEMIKNRTRLVKFKGQEFPFHHPHTQPYTYLGIELTPTMNQTFQQTKVLQEVLRRGENILNSSASPLQKLQFIQRCIKPYAQYSFPLATYSIQSIQKLDSVIARIAKKSLRLPISTPNAMVFTETNQAGMGVQSLLVDYIQLNTAYLVRALNDDGPLGIISRTLLQMQHQHLGGINPLRTKRANSRDSQEFFQESKHCHLALQLSLAKLGGLEVKCHGECAMPAWLQFGKTTPTMKLLQSKHFGPHSDAEIPVHIYLPLIQLGIDDLSTLLGNRRGKKTNVLISTQELEMQFGPGKVTRKHKIALNRLTLYLQDPTYQDPEPPQSAPHTYKQPGSLPLQQRKISLQYFEALQKKRAPDSVWRPSRPNLRTLHYAMPGTALPGTHSPQGPTSPQRHVIEVDLTTQTRKRRRGKNQPSAKEYTPRTFTMPQNKIITEDISNNENLDAIYNPAQWQAKLEEWNGKWNKHMRSSKRVGSRSKAKPLPDCEPAPPQDHEGMTENTETIPTLDEAQVQDAFTKWRTQFKRNPALEHHGDQREPPSAKMASDKDTLQEMQRYFKRRKFCNTNELSPAIFAKYVRNASTNPQLTSLLYEEQEQPQNLLHNRQLRGQEEFLVEWAPTYVLNRHISKMSKLGYTPSRTLRSKKIGKMYGPNVARKVSQVHWNPTFEPTANLEQFNDTHEMIFTFKAEQRQRNTKRASPIHPPRRDSHLSNLEAQLGYTPPVETRVQHPLAQEPQLCKYINLDTQPVNPDLDAVPTGKYEIYIEPNANLETDESLANPPPLANIHGPTGKWLGNLSTARLRILRGAFLYTSTNHPEIHSSLKVKSFRRRNSEAARPLQRWPHT